MPLKTNSIANSKILDWQKKVFDDETRQAIEKLKNNPKELEDCFYKDLEFGTGGMRGVMGVGTNRINKYTIGKITQGISNYLQKVFKNEIIKVAIAFDCRNNSQFFANIVANIFSSNEIKVYLFESLRPTPELSFAVRYLKCQCGIVLTASHNPPEYNGYKVYWKDGGQLVPPQDKAIISEINKIDYDDINFIKNKKLIRIIGKEIDTPFIKAVLKNGLLSDNSAKIRSNLKIVFTPLHGTAINSIPTALKNAGYNNLRIVKEQSKADGNFPTVKSPNPEDPESLDMAIKLAKKIDADIVIGTDPDCDRLGIVVRDEAGRFNLLNGNQAMVVMTKFLLDEWLKQNKLNKKEFIGSTIVSTPMISKISSDYGVKCKLSLTGFKWIAKMIEDNPEMRFICGGEESNGFMVGDFIRDKDAVTACILACEIASISKHNNKSFFAELIKLYVKYGFYKERLISVTKKGIKGSKEISKIMENARKKPPIKINGSLVTKIDDYLFSKSIDIIKNKKQKINLPKSNVIIFTTKDDSIIALRPSGTEPKIKYYISVKQTLKNASYFHRVNKDLESKIDKIISSIDFI